MQSESLCPIQGAFLAPVMSTLASNRQELTLMSAPCRLELCAWYNELKKKCMVLIAMEKFAERESTDEKN